MGDIAFPGIVMLLKLVSRLFVEREVSFMDAMKALVLFPIDIMFLAFSFGAAILYATPPEAIQVGSIRTMFSFLIGCTIIAILITAFCRKSDKALDQKKFGWTIGFSAVTYMVSIIVLIQSFSVGQFLR